MESPLGNLLTDSEMLRRGSYMTAEPLIVVEDSGSIIEEEEEEPPSDGGESPSAPDSPSLNPYLLSPYRDLRKRSLPTPHCTTGIMASQVRRLSEQGGEGSKGPSPIEQAFLATLSSAPAPTPGGRRHSVVTISRVPQGSLFGRNRRESIAAFPSAGLPLGRLQRKDSSSSIARSPSISGSSFNLQLDIMDDIADIKARKARLKMWQTDSQEKVCEVEEAGATSMYHQKENRRFSDASAISPPVLAKRRASELPRSCVEVSTPPSKPEGVVCSVTDLSIMSSLTSSATEIGSSPPKPRPEAEATAPETPKPTAIDAKRCLLKNNRSNSFDISLFPDDKRTENKEKPNVPGNWFTRRHLPMANKKYLEKPDYSNDLKDEKEDKVIWDKPTGAVVDPKMIGSAIEVFLNKRVSDTPAPEAPVKKQQKSWPSGTEPNETEEEVSCDNSICSTLKDLFIK